MMLTPVETLATIGAVALGTIVTRFLPFILFPASRKTHPYITYLGRVLPYAAIGFLVVYCLKGIDVGTAPYGAPEAIAIAGIVALQAWKRNTLLSIGAGTALYMALVQTVFAAR